MFQRQPKALLAVTAGAIAVSAFGFMAWRTLGPSEPTTLPPAERAAKLQHVERVFPRKFPTVQTVTARQVHDLLQQQPDKYVVIDVRNKDEQQVSMLPGSRVLTQGEFEQQPDAYKDATAICYCTVGYRSGLYAQQLQQQGVEAANLQGGILAWTQQGFPLVSGTDRQQPTNQVHTYAARWAYHGDGYAPVYYANAYMRLLQDELSKLKKRVLGGH